MVGAGQLFVTGEAPGSQPRAPKAPKGIQTENDQRCMVFFTSPRRVVLTLTVSSFFFLFLFLLCSRFSFVYFSFFSQIQKVIYIFNGREM